MGLEDWRFRGLEVWSVRELDWEVELYSRIV